MRYCDNIQHKTHNTKRHSAIKIYFVQCSQCWRVTCSSVMAISSCQATSISVSWGAPWDLAPGKLADMDSPPHSLPGVANTLWWKRTFTTQFISLFSASLCVVASYLTGSPQRENIVGCWTHSDQALAAKGKPGEHTEKQVITTYRYTYIKYTFTTHYSTLHICRSVGAE